MMSEQFELDRTSEPVCPYCGHRNEEWWRQLDLHDSGGDQDFVCERCDRKFYCEVGAVWNFTTRTEDDEGA